MSNQDQSVSESIVERYNRVHPQIRNRPGLKSISDALEKAMDAFGAAVKAAEDALSQAEGAASV